MMRWQSLIKSMVYHIPFLRRVSDRITEIVVSMHGEPTEIISLIFAFGWLLPLILYPDYMQSSIYLRGIAQNVPKWTLFSVLGSLFLYQISALLIVPQRVVTSSDDPIQIAEAKEKSARITQFWLKRRMWGCTAAALVWCFVGALLCAYRISGGAFWHFGVSGLCWIGAWRLRVSMYVEREVAGQLKAGREGALIARQFRGTVTP